MKKNIVILHNESGLTYGNAPLGQHATLAYICAAISEDHTVYLIDHSRDSLQSCLKSGKFPALKLGQNNFGKFVSIYQERNDILSNLSKEAGAERLTSDQNTLWNQVADRDILKVCDVEVEVNKDKFKSGEANSPKMIGSQVSLLAKDLQNSYILNRLDPMLASFTLEDKEAAKANNQNVYQYFLDQYKKLITDLEFSDPTNKCDKVAPEKVDEAILSLGKKTIYIPTQKSTVDNFDTTFEENFQKTLNEENQLFPRNNNSEFEALPHRFIFKPIDSAQSSGVCGIEFRPNGLNLKNLLQVPMNKLVSEDMQLLYVDQNLLYENKIEEIRGISKLLLYAQALKEKSSHEAKINDAEVNSKTLEEEINKVQITEVIKELYETDILIQPFLVGVAKMGDVRVNLVADADGKWSVVGHTFRAQLEASENHAAEKNSSDLFEIGSRFTTCFSAGKAAPTRVEYMLSKEEIVAFNECVTGLLEALNGDLKESYKTCQELGVDLVPVGDGKSFKLGEINHAGPALAPVSSALRKGAYDLFCEITNKEKSTLSDKEKIFLENYRDNPNFEKEKDFVANEHQGGLGVMKTSLQNVITRQDQARKLTTKICTVFTAETLSNEKAKDALHG